MLVQSLRLRDFRNLAELTLAPDSRFNIIEGANGQGKTNLLESIYFLAALRSFRALRNAAIVRTGADEAQCEAWIDRGGVRREVSIAIGPRARRIRLNGNTVRRLGDFFGTVNAVAFTPEDVAVMRGSPGDRRAFIDRMIFNAHPGFAVEMAEYETALKNRNALVRDGEVRDRSLLEVYDHQLARCAAVIARRRIDWLEALREPFAATFDEIFGGGVGASVSYRPSFLDDETPDDPGDAGLASAMRDALEASLRRDLQRGHTTVGPHRDDFDGAIDGRSAREYASQGQHRSYVLSLKITEIRLSTERNGHSPILLLDDVSSELDPARNARLFEFLSSIDGQVFITTTDAAFVRLDRPSTRWTMAAGVLTDA